jgi:Uncharacterized protein conserved in bacteria
MKEKTESEALHRMAAYCSMKECCVHDVRKKVSAMGLDGDVVERIVKRLVDERFLDDSRFANAFVKDKLRFNKWGRIKIGYELRGKGVEASVIANAIESIDEDEYMSVLQDLLKAKKHTLRGKDERAAFNCVLRFAAGRGFESREILPCLKKIFSVDVDEDFVE